MTEKLHLFRCSTEDELRACLKKHVYYVSGAVGGCGTAAQYLQERGAGLACLLYSIVLSRGWTELTEDMQDQADLPLVEVEDRITTCLSNLMLTGVATPYLYVSIQLLECSIKIRCFYTQPQRDNCRRPGRRHKF